MNSSPPDAGLRQPDTAADRTVSGVLRALSGHALTLVPLVLYAVLHSRSPVSGWFGTAFLAGQTLVPVACLGMALRRRSPERHGFGRGLMIGWLAGLLWVLLMAAVLVTVGSVRSGECCY